MARERSVSDVCEVLALGRSFRSFSEEKEGEKKGEGEDGEEEENNNEE